RAAVDVKQVGRELGVRYVLEGSLRKSANRIRVTAQLVEAETGKHVWAERYDRDPAEMFAVQDEITEALTIAVAPAVADADPSRDAQATRQPRRLGRLPARAVASGERPKSFFGRPSISTRISPMPIADSPRRNI